MSAPSGEPSVASEGQPSITDPKYAPTPANVPSPPAPQDAPEAPESEPELSDFAKDKIAKANREAKNLRDRLRELEPLAQEAQARAEAEKSDLQRANERAAQLEQQLATATIAAETNGLAARYGIPETHLRYIVGTTPEERADAAAGIAEMLQAAQPKSVTPPPSNKPVENLQPGATPVESNNQPPTEYPSWWIQQPRKG